MQLEAIKVFCDLASLRSFSKAAVANDRSQPAVSRIVHELEQRLGGKLVDRSCRPLQLTPLGQAYYEGCKQLLERFAELEASLMRSPPALGITIHVAAIYSVGLGDMGQYVQRFEAQHPHAKVHIDYVHPDQVYERIEEGVADFGLVSFPRHSREWVVHPWRDEVMVVACSPRHPLSKQVSVRLPDLDGQKYIAFEKNLVIRKEVDRFLREHDVAVEIVHEFDNIESIKRDIEVGHGLALLPEPMLRQEVQTGSLRALPLEGARLVRPLGIIHRRRPVPGSAVKAFIDLLKGADRPASAVLPNGAKSKRAKASRNGAAHSTAAHARRK
jgi:DNA-binding transcriptional LysR family regulator